MLLYKESTHSLAFLYIIEIKKMGKFPCVAIQFHSKRNSVPKTRNSDSLLPHTCSGVLISLFTELHGPCTAPSSALTSAFALVLGQLDINSPETFHADLVLGQWL